MKLELEERAVSKTFSFSFRWCDGKKSNAILNNSAKSKQSKVFFLDLNSQAVF